MTEYGPADRRRVIINRIETTEQILQDKRHAQDEMWGNTPEGFYAKESTQAMVQTND